MKLAYLDTSAFLRALVSDADDHAAAKEVLAGADGWRFTSSELLCLAARRVGIRIANINPGMAGIRADIDLALRGVSLVPWDRQILAAAAAIPETVTTLDAIHIATAELLGDSLDAVLTYDRAMADVLRAHALPAATASDILN